MVYPGTINMSTGEGTCFCDWGFRWQQASRLLVQIQFMLVLPHSDDPWTYVSGVTSADGQYPTLAEIEVDNKR